MSEGVERPRSVGRPIGKTFGVPVRAYDNEQGVELMQRLAEMRGVSVAALLRLLVKEEAARRGLVQDEWGAAAARLKSHYETSPEVQAWQEAEEGYLEPAPREPHS